MELIKKHIKVSTQLMIASLKTVNTVELYGEPDYNFVYGLQEKHTSIKKMYKEIKRIIWQKKSQ